MSNIFVNTCEIFDTVFKSISGLSNFIMVVGGGLSDEVYYYLFKVCLDGSGDRSIV